MPSSAKKELAVVLQASAQSPEEKKHMDDETETGLT
jgi:hypothetical protein